MLLVNSHKLKIVAASTSGRKRNQRAAIIEGLRVGRSPTEIIRFFRYLWLEINRLWRCGKI